MGNTYNDQKLLTWKISLAEREYSHNNYRFNLLSEGMNKLLEISSLIDVEIDNHKLYLTNINEKLNNVTEDTLNTSRHISGRFFKRNKFAMKIL